MNILLDRFDFEMLLWFSLFLGGLFAMELIFRKLGIFKRHLDLHDFLFGEEPKYKLSTKFFIRVLVLLALSFGVFLLIVYIKGG